jgi:hypothetical protein
MAHAVQASISQCTQDDRFCRALSLNALRYVAYHGDRAKFVGSDVTFGNRKTHFHEQSLFALCVERG